MKVTKYILAALIAAPVLSSCSDDFLEVKAPMQEFIDEYYTTDAHIQEAVVAAYDPLHWSDWSMGQYNPLCIMSDIMADDIWVGGANKTDNAFWHLMMNYEALPTNCMTGLWTVAYSGVKRCNDVIQYIGWAGNNLKEADAKYYTAQALTLRCLYYNWLWKFWGNIPYYEENLKAPFIAEQLPADKVYENVMVTLESVIAMDVLPMKESAERYGRVTKSMAYMLYAEMAMYQNDETRMRTAAGYMNEIITSGQFSLVPDYTTIFLESGEWSSESIYEINYFDDNSGRSYDNVLAVGGTILPQLISPQDWKGGNGYASGWGFAPVRRETFEMYAEGDARREATCWDAAAMGEYTARYQDTGLFLAKYIAMDENRKDQIGAADMGFNNNLRIYRYAETLLNAAELIIRGYGSGDAAGYLNQVHQRAGNTDTVDATLENIVKERRMEFVGEGKRYWDLIRLDLAASTLVPDQYGYRTNSWTPSKKYLPIPQAEMDADNNLTQNPY